MSAPPPPPPPRAKPRSSLGFWLGCFSVFFVLFLVVVAGIMWWMMRRNLEGQREPLAAGWQDSLRVRYRLPDDVARLAPPRTDSGDALALLGSRVADRNDEEWRTRRLLLRSFERDTGSTPADRAVIAGVLADTAADYLAAAARRQRLDVLTRLEAADDSSSVLLPPLGDGLPLWSVARVHSDGLALRGYARLERRDLAGARRDFATLVGLGALLHRDEINLWGVIGGRRLIGEGARGLERVAAAARDTVLAGAAGRVAAWAGRRPSGYISFGVAREQLLTIAADTGLPRGVRSNALADLVYVAIFDPPMRLLLGPRGDVVRAVRALERDPDPVLARFAVVADSTLAALDRLGVRGRVRLVSGRAR